MSQGSDLQVLLVHANPFQPVIPVPPYGLERLRTAVDEATAEVHLLDPYLTSDDPIGTAVSVAEHLRPDIIGLGVRIVDDCIVVDRLEAPDDHPIDVTWFLPEIRELRRALGTVAPNALFLVGGAGFSAMPHECLEYLEIDHGVVGAGETVFRLCVEAVRAGTPLDDVRGVVRRGDDLALDAYALDDRGVTVRDPFYAPTNGFPIRTRIGCAMECAYCVTANLKRRHSDRQVEAVIDEVELLVEQARKRGVRRVPIFFADDEFNLPSETHTIEILEGILERRLSQFLSWTAYFNPVPLSDRLAKLIKATNGRPSITVDTAAETVMIRAQKPFRRRHLDQLIKRLSEQGVSADVGLIFGLPGETEETIAETAEFVCRLPSAFDVVYSSGARVYPHTPLAEIAEREQERLVGAIEDGSFLAPVVYSSPYPPRDLARILKELFKDVPNVRQVGLAYQRGPSLIGMAYKVVSRVDGREDWASLLRRPLQPDGDGNTSESVAACLQLALWHGRLDLAAAACNHLVRQVVLPPGLSRSRLRLARLIFALAGVAAWTKRHLRTLPKLARK